MGKVLVGLGQVSSKSTVVAHHLLLNLRQEITALVHCYLNLTRIYFWCFDFKIPVKQTKLMNLVLGAGPIGRWY